MGALTQFSTVDVQPSDRLAYWSDFGAKAIGAIHADLNHNPGFNGRMEYGQAGDLHLCRIRATGHRIERTRELSRRDQRGFVKLAIQLKGQVRLSQFDREITISPGEWSIYDMSQPFSVTVLGPMEELVVLIPRDQLICRRVDLKDVMVRAFSAEGGVDKLACQFITSLYDEMGKLSPESIQDLSRTSFELIRLALMEHACGHAVLSRRSLLQERAKNYIGANLRNPNLSVDAVAEAMGCTKRYLHKIFADEEDTLSRYIWNTRLERCYGDLTSGDPKLRSITDIAFSWGFNSSAHFSRMFKGHYGVSPRQRHRILE